MPYPKHRAGRLRPPSNPGPTGHRRSSPDLPSAHSPLLCPRPAPADVSAFVTSKRSTLASGLLHALTQRPLHQSMFTIQNDFILPGRCLAKMRINQTLKALRNVAVAAKFFKRLSQFVAFIQKGDHRQALFQTMPSARAPLWNGKKSAHVAGTSSSSFIPITESAKLSDDGVAGRRSISRSA